MTLAVSLRGNPPKSFEQERNYSSLILRLTLNIGWRTDCRDKGRKLETSEISNRCVQVRAR